ncbi:MULTISPECIES: hypothetical protein [unclassified Rhizobium]|uniref:hypothetical protein n=1 Tax=unclassified Rhizobium TaxID=2613769 RepID=UPI00131A56B1|nr:MULTISPECIES: hypothetical protein [Rhizobium]MDK4738002.1 hypothetical protein [Rhizobium sp. CNPSo 3464]UWU23180.1 hypothetical protein N2601_09640 [Rhizobium tropici]
MSDEINRSRAHDIGLFLVLVVLAGLLLPARNGALSLTGTFYLALFIHIGFSIYIGDFSAWRKVPWVLLIGVWVMSELVPFLSFLVPWGQLEFWLAQFPLIGNIMAAWSVTGYDCKIVLSLALLIVDLGVMHHATWQRHSWRRIMIFLAVVGVAAVVSGIAFGLTMNRLFSLPDLPTEDTFQIVSPWYLLPFYALLRATENKLGGLLLMFGAMLAPAIAPFMRAERLRQGHLWRLWLFACLALAIIWAALGYLGSLSPDESAVVYLVPVLTTLYFAFFLIVPSVLGRLVRRAVAAEL